VSDNLYAPPQADLSKPVEKIELYKGGFDSSMTIAAVLLIVFFTALSTVFYLSDMSGFDLLNELVSAGFGIALYIFTIYFIKRLRYNGVNNSDGVTVKALGIWGYFWRGLVTQLLSSLLLLVPLGIVAVVTGIDILGKTPEVLETVIFSVALFPLSLLCAWLLFSKNRSGQLKAMLGKD